MKCCDNVAPKCTHKKKSNISEYAGVTGAESDVDENSINKLI